MNTIPQHNSTKFCTQTLLPFVHQKNNMNDESMALADRIRVVLSEMDGDDYGKKARLADIAKCGRSVVIHWLTGQEKINGKHALNIANGLGYRVEWLMEGKGPKRKGEPEGDVSEAGEPLYMIHVTKHELDILTAYRAADAMDKAVFDHLTRSMKKKSSEDQK